MKGKKQLLCLAPFPPPFGGVSVHARRLAFGLERQGWTINRVAAGRSRPADGSVTSFVGNSPLAHAFRVACGRESIVHIHDRISVLTFVASAVAKAQGKKVIITKHGVPRRFLRNDAGVDWFLSRALRMADRVIAVNTHVEELLRPHVRKAIHVCPAYLPPSEEELRTVDPRVAEWLDNSDTAPIVTLVIYRLLPPVYQRQDVYGLQIARRAIVEAVSRGVSLRFALLLACAPADNAERTLWSQELQIFHSSLGSRFGAFIDAFAPPILARTEILLRPTLTDGDAVSIREGLDLGCQVIASDAVRRPEGVLTHGKCDAHGLADLIVEAIGRSSARVRRRATEAKALQDHIELYESLFE